MNKKRKYLSTSYLIVAPALLYGGTCSPEDGLLSFLIILGFLLAILGILHLADFVRKHIRKFLERLLDGLRT